MTIYDERCPVCGGIKVVQVQIRYGDELVSTRPENFEYEPEVNEVISGCHCVNCGIQYFKVL